MSFAGTITYISGDNLGSQAVGRFKEGSGANLKCRHCMGEADEMKFKVYTFVKYLMWCFNILNCN